MASEQIAFTIKPEFFNFKFKPNKPSEKVYIAGKRGKIICAGDCYHVKNIKPENRLIFSSVKEALDNGCKRVCKHCLGTYTDDIWKVALKRYSLSRHMDECTILPAITQGALLDSEGRVIGHKPIDPEPWTYGNLN